MAIYLFNIPSMKKIIALAILTLVAATPFYSYAQDLKAVHINEVMVANTTSVVDDYGERNGWVELFNGNFAPINISSLYLTNDKNDPKKYPVPIGDVNTRIEKRQHVIFYADGQPNRGTFHTNFVFVPGQENWVGLYDAAGNLIDEVLVPANVEANQTYARSEDGCGEWQIRTGGENDYITPSGANIIKDTNSKVDKFAELDGNGFGMTIIAMGIVFLALLVLCLCFYGISKIGEAISKMNKFRSGKVKAESVEEVTQDTGEEIAAIVLALHEHLNAHDTENTILTINKVKRAYSPWSSKIYNLREVPEVQHRKH